MQNKQLWENHISDIAASSTSSYQAAGGQFPLVSSSMSEERSRNSASSAGIFLIKEEESEHEMELYPTPSAGWARPAPRPQPSPPPPPPGVDSPPPPPPPITPPPASPPPPPPDSTELEEGELPDVDMDVEDSNSSGSVTYSGKASQSDDHLPVPSNVLESCSSTGSPDHQPRTSTSAVSSTSAVNSEQLAIIVKPPQPVVSSSSGFAQVSVASSLPSAWTYSAPSCSSTQNAYHFVPMTIDETSAVPGTASVPFVDSVNINEVPETSVVENGSRVSALSVPSVSNTQQPLNMACASTSTSSSASGSTSTSKKEKKKSKLLPGLALKRKNIPNLVEKWVKIKKQQEKENQTADEARISTSM